jgi:hypothetical protein
VAFSRQAVIECGLPLKEMFIWYDDVEYTGRITTGGFAGLAALESGAEHRTAANYAPDVEDLAPTNLWRFRCAFRNEVVVLKTLYAAKPGKLYFQFCKMMLRRLSLLLRARKFRYLPMAMTQGFRGLLFPMAIDYPPSSVTVAALPATDHRTTGETNPASSLAPSVL